MKSSNKYETAIIDCFCIFPKLIGEILLFIVNAPLYLYKFFSGLRLFADSYDGIITGLETQKKFGESLMKSKVKEEEFSKLVSQLASETIRLKKIHDEMFTGLFGVLIAVLALFISILALFIKK